MSLEIHTVMEDTDNSKDIIGNAEENNVAWSCNHHTIYLSLLLAHSNVKLA